MAGPGGSRRRFGAMGSNHARRLAADPGDAPAYLYVGRDALEAFSESMRYRFITAGSRPF